MHVGDALKTHVKEKLEDINSKYFGRAIEANVKFAPEGHSFVKAHIHVKVGKDIMVSADNIESEAYAAFDIAAARIAKQLRRYKRRLRDHHERMDNSPKMAALKARDYVLAEQRLNGEEGESTKHADEERGEDPNAEDPAIIAEVTSEIKTMSVSEAVMRMDLANETALLFRNAKHNRLNMVYRRKDGNVGWVDPENDQDFDEVNPKSEKRKSA